MSERWQLPAALLLAVAVRVPFWAEALRTPVDGDTAIIGLMARHPGRGTTMWGQPYGSPLEAWLAAPLVAAMGPRAEPLRLLYFLLGLGAGAGRLGARPRSRPARRAARGRADGLPAARTSCCSSSLPPPLYPAGAPARRAVLLLAALGRLAAWPAAGEPARLLLAWGVAAGLALWTHLMTASVVAVAGAYLGWPARRRPRALVPAAVALAAGQRAAVGAAR